MRKVNYILPIVNMILFITWILFFSKLNETEGLKLWQMLLIILTDILVNLIVYFWIKNQVMNYKIIFFNFKRSSYLTQTNIIELIFYVSMILFLVFVVKIESFNFNLFAIFWLIYMRLIDFLLFNRSNRLYLDVYGIIELNWRKPGIKWEKVEKFKIANNEMEIRSSKSELLYEVSEEESEQIIEFIKNQKIAVPNSNYNW